MTRTVGSGLQLHYDGSVASETSLWQITRQDGIVLRLTSHDQDVVFAGDTYLTGYETPIDTGTNTLTVLWWTLTGSLSLGDIWVDFTWLDADDVEISSTSGTHFDPVGSNNFVQVSQTNTIPALTRSVIVEFNGANGGFEGTIDDITIATSMVDPNFPTDEFKYGVLTFDTGLNAGISKYIKSYDGTSKKFELFESLPFPVTVGDKVGVHIGCNKELSRCIALDNVLNHGGFPFIPGDDDFLRYPDSPY